ncbi:phosphatidylinositol alpha 1,6-mannosyltransferase [Diaminobutyricimonas aerilata]|uniref:D-inositol 3-phosphate glycosyltransferase n=1 Tax=Diaminobutyricimonas aerilata TaxID=1162967 RepID=A0A2M9CH44_9MICO|nr:glycosyltransferase family 1 protein [Diaminobutyricimonas aerilata]PJJ71175.1 phosphatidylinositol alpha 1,6-mannosyltransferase [Diaminobutyricimonas aerilata]
MRIAVITESFLPTLNGVTTSVRKVLDHLRLRGHEAMVIVPSAGAPREYAGFPVHSVPALAYRQFPVGLPSPHVQRLLADFRPDVLHAASPFLLGAQGIDAARRLGVPSVAVFQTDVAGYARRNRLTAATGFAWRVVRWVHDGADLTLAPSTASLADLERAGVDRLARWGRGVDLDTYHPRNRLDPVVHRLRQRLAPRGETIVGYVGRVAPEKQLERLAALRGLDGVRVVIVGDGPSMPSVRRALKGMPVRYLGSLTGQELAAAYASFDVFVHTGTEETFGQTLQEAHASGLPVIAPRAGGPIDLVDEGVDGYLVEPGDDRGLRAYVELLSTDTALRARMGEAGRRAVLGRSWESVCDELIGHYERVRAERTERVRLAR